MNSPLIELHRSLTARYRPEDVADLVLRVPQTSLSCRDRATLERVAQYSFRRRGYVSSMPDDFHRPDDGARQVGAVARLFGRPEWAHSAVGDPDALAAVAVEAGREIGWTPGRADFLTNRLNRSARAAVGMDISKRQYNRRFRALGRLHAKAAAVDEAQQLRRLLLISRSGFACDIPQDRFVADRDAACFVAYYTARRNLRREFTLSGRQNPFDEVAELLLARCESREDTDWAMVAAAYSKPEVLSRISDAERGELLGRWVSVMRACAERLEKLWRKRPLNRESMVVRCGDDSSTWNTVAAAYNAARAGWLSCLEAMNALALLDVTCPGKVMRLMAADLAWWHTHSGGDLDPNTKVWARLPLPWDVLAGRASCTRFDVEQACRDARLDPAQSGWTASPPRSQVATFTPTPELVHGVSIADPVWASLLRRAGVFSGKHIKPDLAEDAVRGLMAGVVVSPMPSYPGSGKPAK